MKKRVFFFYVILFLVFSCGKDESKGPYCWNTRDGICFIYAASSTGIAISRDGGNSFTSYAGSVLGDGTNEITGIFVSKDFEILTLFGNFFQAPRGISISDNDASSWTRSMTVSAPNTVVTFDADKTSGNKIFVAGYEFLKVSTDNGASFSNKLSVSGAFFRRVFVDKDDNVYAIVHTSSGSGAGVYISTDGGENFTLKSSSGMLNNYPNIVHVDGEGTVYIGHGRFIGGSGQGGLSISTNKGTSFTTTTGTGSSNAVLGLSTDSKNNIYVVNGNGLWISKNGGSSFTQKTTSHGLVSNATQSIFVNSAGVILIGTNSGISISYDGGESFITKTTSDGLAGNQVSDIYSI